MGKGQRANEERERSESHTANERSEMNTERRRERKLIHRTRHLILDESDRLLSSDFLPQITPIVEACTNKNVQKCFLSATMPAGPEAIASGWLNEGVRVVVGLK